MFLIHLNFFEIFLHLKKKFKSQLQVKIKEIWYKNIFKIRSFKISKKNFKNENKNFKNSNGFRKFKNSFKILKNELPDYLLNNYFSTNFLIIFQFYYHGKFMFLMTLICWIVFFNFCSIAYL